MANYEYVGTLKNGRHYIVELGKYFEAGEEAPLTEADVTAFGDRFTNVHKAKASELKAFAIGNDEADKIEALQAKLKAAEQARLDAEKAAEQARLDAEKAIEEANKGKK